VSTTPDNIIIKLSVPSYLRLERKVYNEFPFPVKFLVICGVSTFILLL
jgi:hypothetical protein